MLPFEDDQEALQLGGPIVRMFRTGLARVPDQHGLLVAVRRLRAGGTTLHALAAAMAVSPEFLARHGPDAPADAFFLKSLFRSAFGRDPDPAAIKTLVGPTGTARAAMLLAVSESAEAKRLIQVAPALFPDGLPPDDPLAYQLWLQQHRDAEGGDLREMERLLESSLEILGEPTLVSLLIPVEPIRPDLLLETLAAVQRQVWPAWEALLLCADDLPPHARRAAEDAARRIPGVRIVTADSGSDSSAAGGIALANAGLHAAKGALCGFLDAGDVLADTALLELAAEFAAHPDAVLTYADEDQVDGAGRRTAPVFKGDWSWDLALAGDIVGQPALYRTRRLLDCGGLQPAAAPHERYDLMLRATRDAREGDAVRHLPRVLLHRGRGGSRNRPPPFPERTTAQPDMRAVAERCLAASSGTTLRLGMAERAGGAWPAVSAVLPARPPLVTVIMPIRDRPELLETCATGVLDRTDYPAIELIVADNGSAEPETRRLLRRLERDARVRVLPLPGAFNWSLLNNAAAREARGDVLLLLNNDIEVVDPGWLAPLVAHAMRPEVGAAGARLLYPGPDQRLQHGGIALNRDESAVHLLHYATPERAGYRGALVLTRPTGAVTGACLATRKAVFEEVGGLDERLRVAWNDVDYCLRVRARGLQVVWTPDSTLLHLELATRGRDMDPQQVARHEGEHSRFLRTWRDAATHDPFLNPNLRATADGDVVLGTPVPPRSSPEPRGGELRVRPGAAAAGVTPGAGSEPDATAAAVGSLDSRDG